MTRLSLAEAAVCGAAFSASARVGVQKAAPEASRAGSPGHPGPALPGLRIGTRDRPMVPPPFLQHEEGRTQ